MELSNIELKYYIFDWDDNILHLDTKIHMEKFNGNEWKSVDVSTSEFAEVRNNENYRIAHDKEGNPDPAYAFYNFSHENEEAFLNDCKKAIEDIQKGPSFYAFKKCLLNASLFAIVTTRGHHASTLKKGVKYFIEKQFNEEEKQTLYQNINYFKKLFNKNNQEYDDLDFYLDSCSYIGVNNPDFIEEMKKETGNEKISSSDMAYSKEIAIKKFVKQCHEYGKLLGENLKSIKIGFSDDDKGYSKRIAEVFETELKKSFPEIKFAIYDTSKNDDGSINYKKYNI